MTTIGESFRGCSAGVGKAAWRLIVTVALVLAAGCESSAPGNEVANPGTRAPSDAAGQTPAVGPDPVAATAGATYADQIRPMLEQPCLACHGRWLPQAGLSMVSRESLIKGGRSGPAIVPGDSGKGWLIHALTIDTGKYRMPPQGPRLSDGQVDLVRRWIDAGAP